MIKKTISVLGLGYIGLPTAALLAQKGNLVLGIETNEKVRSILSKGQTHIIEKNLDIIVKSALNSGNLKVYENVQQSDIYIIAVPTPLDENNNELKPNINYVLTAAKSIAPKIKSGDLVILESTSPVGTTEKIRDIFIESGVNLENVCIAYCPERVLPGNILTEIIENDRIIGGLDITSSKRALDFYSSFVTGNIFQTDSKTAEMCKLVENSYRDLNIAFANELSILCEKKGIDVWNLINLANKHPRVNILQPSVGVGGHCIAIDPWFLVSYDKTNTKLIRTARKINNLKNKWVIKKIKLLIDEYYLKNQVKPKVACLGLSYKPNTDDLRESKALEIVENLIAENHQILIVEPNIKEYNNLKILEISYAIQEADIICILVKHDQFLKLDIKNKLIERQAVDFCGAINEH